MSVDFVDHDMYFSDAFGAGRVIPDLLAGQLGLGRSVPLRSPPIPLQFPSTVSVSNLCCGSTHVMVSRCQTNRRIDPKKNREKKCKCACAKLRLEESMQDEDGAFGDIVGDLHA
jgi:hypothetical protein